MSQALKSQHIPRGEHATGYRRIAGPENAPLTFLEFGLATVDRGERLHWPPRAYETVIYLLGGECVWTISGAAGALSGVLDSREGIFDGPPSAVFMPAGSRLHLESRGGPVQLAFFSTPPREERPPYLIEPQEATVRTIGAKSWTRRVVSVVDERIASRLLVGETINVPGNWSSYPPHKHDADLPGQEVPMEEVYHFCLRPPGGFGVQLVYTAKTDPFPFDESYRVSDGDTVVIPRGYHPVVAAAGYQLAYLWAISGERVKSGAWTTEPTHRWLIEPRE